MDKKLHVLVLKDESTEVESLERKLRKAKIDFTSKIVSSKQEFSKELIDFIPDVVLTGCDLDSFDELQEAYSTLSKQSEARTYELELAISALQAEVSERKRAEASLQERTNELEAVFRAFPDCYFWVDSNGTVLAYHAPFASKLNMPSDVIMKPLKHIFPSDVSKILNEAISEADSRGRLVACEYSIPTPNEKQIFEARISPLFENRLIIIVRNITRQKRAEEDLRSSEALLSSIIDQSPFSTWVANAEGTNIRQNASCRKLFGIELDEQTVGLYNLFKDNVIAEQGYLQTIKDVFEKGQAARFTIFYNLSDVEHVDVPGGAYRILDTTIFPVKDSNGQVINAVLQHDDITSRVRATEELSRRLNYESMIAKISSLAVTTDDIQLFQNNCLRTICKTMDISRAYIFEYHSDTATINNVAEWTAFGIAPQIELQQNLSLHDFPLWVKAMKSKHAQNMDNISTKLNRENIMLPALPDVKSHLVVPLYIGDSLYGFLGLDHYSYCHKWPEEDISILHTAAKIFTGVVQRRKAEDALRESERKYRELVENAQEGIWAIDEQNNTVFVNARMAEMLGYTINEMLGMSLYNFFDEKTVQKAKRAVGLHRTGLKGTRDVELLKKDSTRVFAKVKAWPSFKDGKYSGAIAFMTDNTEQRELEAQLRLSQRLDAIGRMTGGISHEFKNLLMGISGYAEVLQMTLGNNHPHYSTVNDLLHCVDRSSKLIDKLLTFSKKQSIDPRPTDLNMLVTDSKGLIERLLGEHIDIEMNLCPDIGTVNIDPGQIEQVLVNLVINARDAMPQGGRLTIETACRTAADIPLENRSGAKTEHYNELIISDSGIGMDESTRERIFEPFFTTKESIGHTGLGLAVTYGIIKQHNGHISIDSQPEKGTTFRVLLPVVDSEPLIETDEAFLKITKGKETILLAEDEESVRTPAKSFLESCGYSVISASNGNEAVELFLEHADKVSLVILDMVMPKSGGRAVFETIIKSRPDIKVLFISGYSAPTVHKDFAPPKDKPFLSKPFSLVQLTHKVRDLLDQK